MLLGSVGYDIKNVGPTRQICMRMFALQYKLIDSRIPLPYGTLILDRVK